MMPDQPATPFWEGYKRPPEMVEQLLGALRGVMETHRTERLGQLLMNAIGDDVDLFNIWDEQLIHRLNEYARVT